MLKVVGTIYTANQALCPPRGNGGMDGRSLLVIAAGDRWFILQGGKPITVGGKPIMTGGKRNTAGGFSILTHLKKIKNEKKNLGSMYVEDVIIQKSKGYHIAGGSLIPKSTPESCFGGVEYI